MNNSEEKKVCSPLKITCGVFGVLSVSAGIVALVLKLGDFDSGNVVTGAPTPSPVYFINDRVTFDVDRERC